MPHERIVSVSEMSRFSLSSSFASTRVGTSMVFKTSNNHNKCNREFIFQYIAQYETKI